MNTREIEFLQDLEALLERHDVEFTSVDHDEGYRRLGAGQSIEAYAMLDNSGHNIDIDFGPDVSVEKIQQIIENQT
jgi:hypothetical protein